MKQFYRIKEISDLYSISADSLRYYEEIKILNPTRATNGYRQYSIIDIWKLNVIKDLRNLNFPFLKIKDYLNNRNLKTTEKLLEEELLAIDNKIEELNQIKKNIIPKIENLKKFSLEPITDEIFLDFFPERKCLHLSNSVSGKEEIDLHFRKLQIRSNEQISLVGSTDLCVFMSQQAILHNHEHFYTSVFSFHDNDITDFDFTLKKGNYLHCTYRGPHHLSQMYALNLLTYAKENNLTPFCDPFEICIFDIHETSNPEEFITQIQLGVE